MGYSTMFRALLRARGLSLAVVLTLALGVGLLATTFSLLNGALWRLPPFPDAGRAALLYLERNPQDEAPRRERWSFGPRRASASLAVTKSSERTQSLNTDFAESTSIRIFSSSTSDHAPSSFGIGFRIRMLESRGQ